MPIRRELELLFSRARRISPPQAMLAFILFALFIVIMIPESWKPEAGYRNAVADAAISSGGGVRGRAGMEGEFEIDVTPDVFIEVNIPATELTLYEDGVPLFRRRIAIGRGIYPTPQQVSEIKRIEWNPWWYPPDAAWARNDKPTPPGPRNPLGVVKVPLGGDILFHGTNVPASVGRAASHGCMRMHNRDASELAWYLQERFSDQTDPRLREEYSKKRWKTFRVVLTRPIPVELVYRPVVARSGKLEFYRDHYNRVAGSRKAAIVTELLRAGYEIDGVDDEKVDRLSRDWPVGKPVAIEQLMRKSDERTALNWPECS